MKYPRTRPSGADLVGKEEQEKKREALIPAEDERREEKPDVESGVSAEMLFLEAELIATLLRESGTRR